MGQFGPETQPMKATNITLMESPMNPKMTKNVIKITDVVPFHLMISIVSSVMLLRINAVIFILESFEIDLFTNYLSTR